MRTDRKKALYLRRKGRSYNEIHQSLGIPKSTLSTWLRDVKMSKRVKKELWDKTRRKWSKNITKYNKKRSITAQKKAQKVKASSAKDIKGISKNDLFLIGIALYWAEGHKKSRWRLDFSNSDPKMIRLEMGFFRNICKIPEEKFFATVQTHYNVDPQKAVRYWSKVSGISEKQFIKTYIRKKKINKRNCTTNILPFGTLRISISDMEMTNKMKGWVEGVSKQFNR